jgi:CheY-like chemotaxis protein
MDGTMARILFIDDDTVTLQILGKAAQVLGHHPILINEARPALDIAAQEVPDLIVMDMMMPDMDGIDVLTELRKQLTTSTIPVVILSAGAAWDDQQRVKEAGAQDYLSKPVSLATLTEIIKRYTAPK